MPSEHLFSQLVATQLPELGLIIHFLSYDSSIWDPHYEGLIGESEKMQMQAARFVTMNH